VTKLDKTLISLLTKYLSILLYIIQFLRLPKIKWDLLTFHC